jgi:hypothetical protein
MAHLGHGEMSDLSLQFAPQQTSTWSAIYEYGA